MTGTPLPVKKSVTLPWRGRRLSFDVAQDLFSSHQVDKGSRMLLDSLDLSAFAKQGRGADFGCGYGVLGIAWQTAKPGWGMHYIDRDALAVAFTAHNVGRLGLDGGTFVADIALTTPSDGFDLVLWNVPGKAGRSVIAGLLDATLDALVPGGLLAVVVVHPLADLFTDELQRLDTAIELVQPGTEHTVVHLRRNSGNVVIRDPFEEGLFDRAAQKFSTGCLEWELTPVIGLPEYDELGHATQLAMSLMRDVSGPIREWLVVEPGVGHLAVVASQLWPASRGVVAGRDTLALRCTARAASGAALETVPIWGVEALSLERPTDIAMLALPVQASAEELERGIDAVRQLVAPSGQAILHGRSTEVARAERVLRRRPGWRTGKPIKQRGFAAHVVRTPTP